MSRISLAPLGAVLSAAVALAQVQSQPANESAPVATSEAVKSHGDRMLAHCLIVENRGEVELAQFAGGRTQNVEIKQFTQRMIDDHTKLLSSLEKFGGTAAAAAGGQSPANNAAQQPATSPVPGATGALPGHAMKSPFDFAALKEELGRQCVTSAKAELDQKQGAEFDKCYLGLALCAHKHAVDAITVFRNHASPEFRQVLDEALPVVQAHKEHALQLMKKLDGGTAPQAAGRPTADQPVR
jgi:predicted outer membrane protein